MSALQELGALLRLRLLQLAALTGLLATVGFIAVNSKYCVRDLDIWWHLKVGDWIVQNLAVPHTGILSRTAAHRPWVAYSWGYEVLLSRAYAWFGLLGMGTFGVLLTLGVAYGIFWMLRRLAGRFWPALVLTAIACSAFLFDMMPRPGFFSIILFSVTLALILEANRSGQVQKLYWLPLIFLFWSNLHIQFIYGLFLMGLFLGINLVQRVAAHFGIVPGFLAPAAVPAGPLAMVFAACVLATLVGPYSYHLYGVIAEYSRAKLTYSMIIELQPLSFRSYTNYVELLLGAAGFFAVGRQKRVDLFKMALLLFARGTDFTTRGLDRAISGTFPVNAVNFLRQNPPPGPLYNTFDWGGFLMWYMPQYPVLNEAGVVLLRKTDGLVSTLDLDPRFRKIYQDELASVFVRE